MTRVRQTGGAKINCPLWGGDYLDQVQLIPWRRFGRLFLWYLGFVTVVFLTICAGNRGGPTYLWDGVRVFAATGVLVAGALSFGIGGLCIISRAKKVVTNRRSQAVRKIVQKIDALEPGQLSYPEADRQGGLSHAEAGGLAIQERS